VTPLGHHIIKWLLPLISFGVAIFILFFLITINNSDNVNIDISIQKDSDMSANIKEEKSIWIERFAQNEREGYFYPVNEIYIELDLKKDIVYSKIYRLSATLKDPYQLFCLKQELRQHKLLYYLTKNEHSIELLIFSKDQEKLNSLLNSLQNYQIVAVLEPYKEEIEWKN
jgi:hypothetical protein